MNQLPKFHALRKKVWPMIQAEPLDERKDFSSVAEAIAAASYVEQLLASENNLIVNRLSWLFVSQSFCISAFVVLEVSTNSMPVVGAHLHAMKLALPILGIVCCALVGLASWAGSFESGRLANERARIVHYINKHGPTNIPNLGADPRLRDFSWTQYGGSMPNRLLPLVLMAFWIVALVW
jgi:hypothetical protein